MNIYTKQGDGGMSVVNNEKLPKSDIIFEILGTLDELNSHAGIIKNIIDPSEKEFLEQQQNNIMEVSSKIAGYSGKITVKAMTDIEKKIRELQALYPTQNILILPGRTLESAQIDVARTVARRAERVLSAYAEKYAPPRLSQEWLNRLSDYLYVLARYTDFFITVKHAISVSGNEKNMLSKTKKLLALVEQKAAENNINAVIAVCGADSNIIAAHAMDGAYPVSFDVAVKKAYTAVALKMPTSELSKLAQPGGMFYGIEAANDKIIIIGGGDILKGVEGIAGGIGVSGGTASQDSMLASYGSAAWNENL